MSALLRVEAPSDAQLDFIAQLCRERGWTPPGAVYSKAEASEILGGMLASTYRADDYREPSAAPTHDDADYSFANGTSAYDPEFEPAATACTFPNCRCPNPGKDCLARVPF